MKQTRRSSFTESCFTVGSGFLISLIAMEILFPLYNIQTSFKTNIEIVCIMTIVSIMRTYIVRRCFNRRL
jgi:hypothetical protein